LTTCAEIEIRVKWKVVRTFCNAPKKTKIIQQNASKIIKQSSKII